MSGFSVRNLLIKNAFANVVGGAGSAVFNFLLPALVVKHLGQMEFSVWNLALQVIVYLQLFGFGVQNVIIRFIAHGNELNDVADQRNTIQAGLMLVTGFVAVAIVAVGGLVWFYPLLFPRVSAGLTSEFRTAIAVLGLSAVWQLYALIPTGVFIGLHRNIIAVGGQLLVRLFSLFALWLALNEGAHLAGLAWILALCGGLLVPLNVVAMYRWTKPLLSNFGPYHRQRLREMLHACGSLTVWNIAMLFVNGIDLVVVGHFDFHKVSAYSLAVTAVTILVGVLQAVMSPMIAIGAKLHANLSTRNQMPALVIRTTQYAVLILGVSLVCVLAFGKWALGFWIPVAYVQDVYVLLAVLLVANVVRNSAAPYAFLLVATGLQKYVLFPAMLEAGVNLIASLMLVVRYGAVGVALGTLIGGAVGVCANFWIGFGKSRELVPSTSVYILQGLLLPLIPLFIIAGVLASAQEWQL